jgi:hypothetical protein
MDENTRRMLAEVFAADDQARRDFDYWQSKRKKYPKNLGPGIVIQRLVDRPVPVAPELDHDAWNAWAKTIAQEEAAKLANELVDDLEKYDDALQGRFERRKEFFLKQDADLAARIDALENRLDLIEEQLDLLEGNDNTKRVVSLPKLQLRGRDAG